MASSDHPPSISVVTIKPGFVDTPMTAEFKKSLLWIKSEAVAEKIVRAINQCKDEVYISTFWWAAMAMIKIIPNKVFKELRI
jgi:decaprenylphospho-beta-D-erythro-pentofuranosid-2-ulose 2-reductase